MCPAGSYEQFDTATSVQELNCGFCHYSCKKCVGPKPYQCSECCMNNDCGAIYNRVPTNGECLCNAGLVESNGICLIRCAKNLHGASHNKCYTQCANNAWPRLQWNRDLIAQTRSQYDSSSITDCSDSSYHLKYTSSGKGLAVLGPQDFTELP